MKKMLLFILLILFSCEKKIENFKDENVIKISETGNTPKVKRGFEVVINKRLDETELQTLGNYIYQYFDGEKFQNFFINYYLKGMIIGNGSYASTHFTPNLEVNLTGLSQNEIENIKANNFHEKRFWIDDGFKNIISFRKENNKILMYRYFSDFSKDIREIKFKIQNNDTIFIVPNRINGEEYRINMENDLEQYDNQGYVDKMLKE